jgi:RNA polymerase sigma-70 factor, ECF subfamily
VRNEHAITDWPSLLIDVENPTTEQAGGHSLAHWTRLLADGDDGAWRWFHARYYVTLLRYAAHRSGDASAASEIVQQAYLRIARHAKPFTDEPDFANWLCCIVRCAAADHSRSSARRSLLVEKFAHWRAARSEPDADWPASANDNAALASEALAKLPDADAALLRRKYCEGSTTDELATELATTPKAIEHRLARLRGQLREIILRIQ